MLPSPAYVSHIVDYHSAVLRLKRAKPILDELPNNVVRLHDVISVTVAAGTVCKRKASLTPSSDLHSGLGYELVSYFHL